MSVNLIEIESIENLEELFAASHQSPVVLFKHSTTCGISAGVLRQVGSLRGDIHMIVMQTHRPISNALAERTGVTHESPQAIVIKNGVPVYAASHYDIQPGELQPYLSAKNGDA